MFRRPHAIPLCLTDHGEQSHGVLTRPGPSSMTGQRPWRRTKCAGAVFDRTNILGRAGLRLAVTCEPAVKKKKPASFENDAGFREIIPAVTYSPTQFPTQYHRR